MKWLSNRYAYPMVILVIAVSIVLQLAWLNQLYLSQRDQAKRDLEEMVAQTAKTGTYLSLARGHEDNKKFRAFFLSPQWLQFRQAYSSLTDNNVHRLFSTNRSGDSISFAVTIKFLKGDTSSQQSRHQRTGDDPMAIVMAADKVDSIRMDSIIQQKLGGVGISIAGSIITYDLQRHKFTDKTSTGIIKNADFVSQQYAYNLRFLKTFQLVVPSINTLVIYRMRYYLVSSCFMLLLTGVVFIFLLKLMHNQRLYAQARVSFTSNMTHELKTPVSTVSLALESILENQLENDSKTWRSYLEMSRGELSRLNLMIDKVLNLEQMDSGLTRLRKELFDVQLGLSEALASMKLQIENTDAKVTWIPGDKPCFVSGDPIHLTNVFFNLIENALKYSGKGMTLEISCTFTVHDIRISFKDNGPGIESRHHQRIFERFFRVPAENADVHNIKGTGIGLNYVKQIIEKHSGYLKVESEPGKGSNFIIYLPKGS